MQITISHKKNLGNRQFVCATCNKGFRVNYAYQAHIRIHTGERPFECTVCNKRFTENNGLLRHQRTLSCRRTFVRSKQLHHEKVHTSMEEKLYNCGTCGKSYKREGCLKKHGCNTFTCNTCSKRFNSNANLEIHIRVHTGEKPFCCASCGTLYATMLQCIS